MILPHLWGQRRKPALVCLLLAGLVSTKGERDWPPMILIICKALYAAGAALILMC